MCHGNNPMSTAPYKRRAYRIVKKFQITGSVLNKNKIQNLVLYLDGACISSRRHLNIQNNKCWYCENHHEVHEVGYHFITTIFDTTTLLQSRPS
jgi:hypothetical protein